ncbi:MAG: tyrosine-type recombinase/integrase [Candidatus Pacebacteria bacterium]|nr:tyrosine-type recombinase/integrase [Candidatus Paceibacterota bacterium]
MVTAMPYSERTALRRAVGAYLSELKEGISAETAKQYRMQLSQVAAILEPAKPRDVTLKDMRRLEAELPGNENTLATKCALAKAFLKWTGNIEATKWKIRAKHRPKMDGVFLNESQVEIVRQAARELGVEHELTFSLMADNSFRAVDCQRLTVDQARTLLARGLSEIVSKGKMGGKRRPIALHEDTFSPMVEYLKHRRQLEERYGPTPENLLVMKVKGKRQLAPASYMHIWGVIRKVSVRAGIRFAPHDLRRTFGNRHWRAGTPIETIAKLMGHETIGTTFKAYIGVAHDDMRAAQKRIGTKKTGPSWPSQLRE